MAELTIPKMVGENGQNTTVMYPLVNSSSTYRRNYEGTVPFQSDACYQYFKNGFLTDSKQHLQHSRLGFGLKGSNESFGSANRYSQMFVHSDYEYRYELNPSEYGVFVALILMSNNIGSEGYSGIIPTTAVVLRNLGDSEVFDLPLKVKNSGGNIVADGKVKMRVALGVPNKSSLSSIAQSNVNIIIDTLFTGTKNSTSINPYLSGYLLSCYSKRIKDYDDYPLNSPINYFETNDIATCAYTR